MTRIPVPATVLVGFLGAGKTTLLNHILAGDHNKRIAVIVNDFSAVNVDARLVRNTTDRLVEMTNGCICCTLREDLVQELGELARMDGIDHIVVESTGIGEPMPIAQAFHMGDLENLVRLQEIITVVDASSFWRDFERNEQIENADGTLVDGALGPLLIDQLEFTDIVLLNKCDIATEPDLLRLEGFVHSLSPDAMIVRTTHGNVDIDTVLGTGRYSYDDASDAEGWDEEWSSEPSSEADEYGFNTFTYIGLSPMVHDAFMTLFEGWPDQVLRAKGIVVFEDHAPALVSVVRDQLEIQYFEDLTGDDTDGGDGFQEWLRDEDEVQNTEIVFIGQNMPTENLVEMLDAAQAETAVVA